MTSLYQKQLHQTEYLQVCNSKRVVCVELRRVPAYGISFSPTMTSHVVSHLREKYGVSTEGFEQRLNTHHIKSAQEADLLDDVIEDNAAQRQTRNEDDVWS